MVDEKQEVKPDRAMTTIPTSYIYAGAIVIALIVIVVIWIFRAKPQPEGK